VSDFMVGTCFSNYDMDCHFKDFNEEYVSTPEQKNTSRIAHNWFGFLRRILQCVLFILFWQFFTVNVHSIGLAGENVVVLDDTFWYFKTPFPEEKKYSKDSLAHRAVFCLCGECYAAMKKYNKHKNPISESNDVVSLAEALKPCPPKNPTIRHPPVEFPSVELCIAEKMFEEFLRPTADECESRYEQFYLFDINFM